MKLVAHKNKSIITNSPTYLGRGKEGRVEVVEEGRRRDSRDKRDYIEEQVLQTHTDINLKRFFFVLFFQFSIFWKKKNKESK